MTAGDRLNNGKDRRAMLYAPPPHPTPSGARDILAIRPGSAVGNVNANANANANTSPSVQTVDPPDSDT